MQAPTVEFVDAYHPGIKAYSRFTREALDLFYGPKGWVERTWPEGEEPPAFDADGKPEARKPVAAKAGKES